jgi:hypothetical protein
VYGFTTVFAQAVKPAKIGDTLNPKNIDHRNHKIVAVVDMWSMFTKNIDI